MPNKLPVHQTDVTNNERAHLTIGTARFTVSCADAEFFERLIDLHLSSSRGFGWLTIPVEDGQRSSCSVLVSRGVFMMTEWPSGYVPFASENKLLEDLNRNPTEFGVHN